MQNIDLLDGQPLDELRELGTVTATTAHARYTSAELRERLGVPIHRFSTFVSPEQYERRAYEAKEELLVVSPDEHPSKAAILDCIARAQPHLEIVEVRDLKYDDYKDLIARAKWCLTFGEGLDGYFVESVWSGAVAFAVYNDRFFTQPFSNLRTVYADYASLAAAIVADMRHLDDLARFTEYQRQQWELCASLYQYDTYVENVRLFYAGEYTLP